MIEAVGVADVRATEEAAAATLPEGVLMQRASAGVAAHVVRVLRETAGGVYGRRVLLLVGPGHNGGDALWAGARLARRGADVTALLAHERVHAEGLDALRAAGGRVVDGTVPDAPVVDDVLGVGRFWELAVVVDGLLGMGGRPGLTGLGRRVVDLLGTGTPVVVSVDVPSGIDADSGEVEWPALWAGVTLAVGTLKPGLLLPPAAMTVGELHVVPIGVRYGRSSGPTVRRLEAEDLRRQWPTPEPSDQKYTRGVVGIVAGGQSYTGAAVLAVEAAVLSGAAMVRYVGPPHPTELVRQRRPEVVPGPGRVQAWVVGPGVDPDDAEQAGRVRDALASGKPCVVDAGALELVDAVADGAPRPWLLTPHAGELATLLSRLDEPVERREVEASPLRHARRAADLTGATVLVKGAVTIVVPPGAGEVYSQAEGPPWLATAGAGDVLAGLAGTLLAGVAAQVDAGSYPGGLRIAEVGAMAASVHGRAGTRASSGGPVSALAVAEALPATVAALLHP